LQPGLDSKLQLLLKILQDRDWAMLARADSLCMPAFGTSEVTSWLPSSDWPTLQKLLPQFLQDISTLRQLLANCRSPQQRQALNITNLNRVIAVDVNANGVPVLYFL
jgi:hypothetical protein